MVDELAPADEAAVSAAVTDGVPVPTRPVAPPPGRRASALCSSVWTFLNRPRGSRVRLVLSLNQVASAISSTMSTADVLSTVVDEAKNLLGTGKAVLCLLAEGASGLTIDDSAVFVRGRRDKYPEDWWRARIVDAAGSALEQVAPVITMVDATWLMTVPVKAQGRPIGVLAVMNPVLRRFTNDQIALVAILVAFAGAAIENSRLRTQSQYALLAEERDRIAKEMHDGLSQTLFGVSLELDVCRKRLRGRPAEVEHRLDQMQTILTHAIGELRRYIHDLRPAGLNRLGLVGALHQRATEIGDARGLGVRVYTEGEERRLPPGAEACLYRIAQEAIANVARHATARHVYVVVYYGREDVRLVVEDDGGGFDVADAMERAEREESIGLRSMRDRARSEGGRFSISSSSRGTTVEVELPC
jgi:signal transduction histidine kinase